jgi:hypothetical protein
VDDDPEVDAGVDDEDDEESDDAAAGSDFVVDSVPEASFDRSPFDLSPVAAPERESLR